MREIDFGIMLRLLDDLTQSKTVNFCCTRDTFLTLRLEGGHLILLNRMPYHAVYLQDFLHPERD